MKTSLLALLVAVLFAGQAFADSPFGQAESLWAAEKLDLAIWEYRKALSSAELSERDRAFGLFRLGMAEMAAGQETQAVESYRRVEQRYPEHELAPFALLFQANFALLERSQLGNGIRIYENLIERYPKSDAAKQASEWLPELKKMNQTKLRNYNLKRKRKEAESKRNAERREAVREQKQEEQ